MDRIDHAVLYGNNDLSRDWLAGVVESFVPDSNARNSAGRNLSLFPKGGGKSCLLALWK